MTDNTQELDEILDRYLDSQWNGNMRNEILDWHNKQIGEMLNRLVIDTKLTYDGGGDVLDAVVDFIVTERNELKESK